MLNEVAFLRHFFPFTDIHTLMAEAATQGTSCSSRAIWGSVSCSRTQLYAAVGVVDLNQRPSDY